MAHSKGKKNQQKLKKKNLMADKDFKTTVLKMLKELQEDVKKVKKKISEQNGNNRDRKPKKFLQM